MSRKPDPFVACCAAENLERENRRTPVEEVPVISLWRVAPPHDPPTVHPTIEEAVAAARAGQVEVAVELLTFAAGFLERGEALPAALGEYLATAFKEITARSTRIAFRADSVAVENLKQRFSLRHPGDANKALNLRWPRGRAADDPLPKLIEDLLLASGVSAALSEGKSAFAAEGEVADRLGVDQRTVQRARDRARDPLPGRFVILREVFRSK